MLTQTDGLLAADSAMDAVTLYVRNRDALTAYYRDALLLTEISEDSSSTVLGRQGKPLLVLRHEPDLPRPRPRQAGLFHTALLFESQGALAAAVASAAQHRQSRFVGSADHLVSKAFYFTDPEGNGIELYWDRPRSQWNWTDGHVAMDSLYLDPNDFLASYHTGALLPPDQAATVGHVHLQVGDIPTAKRFYSDVLGFATTAELPGALFVSAGGYHHHMAMNTWNSAGAGPRAASLGLGRVSIDVPTREDVEQLSERARHHGIAVADDGSAITFADPWNTPIEVTPRTA